MELALVAETAVSIKRFLQGLGGIFISEAGTLPIGRVD